MSGVREQHVVASVVTDGTSVCLVRRSEGVHWDKHLWHCVTGYVDDPRAVRSTVLQELEEELGLPRDAVELTEGPVLRMESPGTVWWVHTSLAVVRHHRMRLNWENEAYRWVRFADRPADRVAWLDRVYEALRGDALVA